MPTCPFSHEFPAATQQWEWPESCQPYGRSLAKDQHHSTKQAYGCQWTHVQMSKYTRPHRVPGEWIQAHMAKSRQPPSWWQEFRSFYKELVGRLTANMVQQIAWKQATAFRQPAVQDQVVGWWGAPLSICGLGFWDFLPHWDFCRTRDFRETQREGTLALARALQHCGEKLGGLLGCYVTQYGISSGAWSPSLTSRVMTSQEVWETITCPPDCLEETPKPKGTTGLGWATADPQDAQKQISLPPLVFGPPAPVSGTPPLEDAEPLVSVP